MKNNENYELPVIKTQTIQFIIEFTNVKIITTFTNDSDDKYDIVLIIR